MLSSKAGGYMNGGFLTLDGGRLMVRSLARLSYFRSCVSLTRLCRALASTMVSECQRTRTTTERAAVGNEHRHWHA
jgi:hypothetical protein